MFENRTINALNLEGYSSLPSEQRAQNLRRFEQILAETKLKKRYEILEGVVYWLSKIKKDPSLFQDWDNPSLPLEKALALICLTPKAIKLFNRIDMDYGLGNVTIDGIFYDFLTKEEEITIHIWLPRGKDYGHVAIQTHSGYLYEDGVYLSIWPEENIRKRNSFFSPVLDQKAILQSQDQDLIRTHRPPDIKEQVKAFNVKKLEALYLTMLFLIDTDLCGFNLGIEVLDKFHNLSDIEISCFSTISLGIHEAIYTENYGYHLDFLTHNLISFVLKRRGILSFNCTTLAKMLLASAGFNIYDKLEKLDGLPSLITEYYGRAVHLQKKLQRIRVWSPKDIYTLVSFFDAKELYLKHAFKFFTANETLWDNYYDAVFGEDNSLPQEIEQTETMTTSSRGFCDTCSLQ